MTYVQPHLISSHAQLIGAPHPTARREQPQPESDYKVTGTERFNRPDKDSVWDPGNGGRWIRKWLPGEKEAEAAQRMNPVLAERAQIQHGVSDESWKQREQQKRDWNDADAQARLKAVLDQQNLSPMPGVKTSFPSAPQPDGGTGDKVSLVGETPEVFNKLKKISPELVGMRDSMNDGGLLKPFDTAMTMVLNKIYGNDVVPSQDGKPGSRNLGAIFDSIYQGGNQPAEPAAQDELSGVYEGGGSIFGEQAGGTTDRSLEFLHEPDTESAFVGGESVAWKDYASSVGGMINALLRR